MLFRWTFRKNADSCEVHGASSNAANRMLLLMITATVILIVWRVWTYGPSTHAVAADAATKTFPVQLWGELLDLIFSSHGILAELWDIMPYFLVGLLLGGYLRTYKIAVKLQNSLRKYGVASVFLASFVGIITPLCACGTLTTAISLLFAGLPLAPVMALLVTSPLLSPSAFLLTLNDLGPEWTVIRTFSAYFMGVFAGLAAHMLRNRGFSTKELFIEGALVRGDFHDEDYPDERLRCNCRQQFSHRLAVRTSSKFLIFLAKSAEMCWPVGKYILVGVIIGSVVERYMPYQWIYRIFGSKDPLSILWVTLGSVPLFLHQISASSILYHIKSTIDGTLDGGAALAFIIGGPVTAIPTLALFWSVFKRRVFVFYLVVCLAGTLIIAYGARLLVFLPGVDTGNAVFRGVGVISGGSSATIEKKNPRISIILDANNRKTIAVADKDPMSGQGGMIFDAGANRFTQGAHLDDVTYFANAAQWLEQGGGNNEKAILIYGTGRGPTPADAGIAQLAAKLRQEGFKVKMIRRGETWPLSAELLAGFNQLWVLFDDAKAGHGLAEEERKAVSVFTDSGNSLFIMAGAGQGPDHDMAAVNGLSNDYGISFTRYGENSDQIRISRGSAFFASASNLIHQVLKVFHKA